MPNDRQRMGDQVAPSNKAMDAEVHRAGRVPRSYEESAGRAIEWVEANRASMTHVPDQYFDRLLCDLRHGGIAPLRAALYRCKDLRDTGRIMGARK